MKRILFFFSIVVSFPTAWAQFDRPGAKVYEGNHKHSVYFEMPFRDNDFALGGTYRHSIYENKLLAFFATFYARPYGKAVLIKSGDRFYFQLKEYRYVFAGGLDKKYWINNRWDGFMSIGVGYSVVDYRGTGEGVYRGHAITKKEGFTPVVNAGVSYKFSRYVFLRLGGQYLDMRTSPDFRFYLGVGGQF